MEYSLKNLEKIVQKKADDTFIKSIIRKYINIDIDKTSPFREVNELLYAELRIDENSAGKINEEDKRKFVDEVKRDFISRYGVPQYNPLKKPQPGWFTYKSWKLLGTDRISEGEYRHRLYINSKASNLMALSHAIYDELKKRKIPFYFKIPDNENNEKGYKDSIVLYTTTPLLAIKAILEIEKNNPNLVRNCNAPSELVGQINDYIGYAFESENAKCSYTTLICKSFENGIENAVKNWCLNNRTVKIENENLENYYLDEDEFNELKKKTQKLVYTIPKVDKEFPAMLCNSVRNEMEKLGIDPNNICMDKKTSADIKAFCDSSQKLELTPDGETEENKRFSQGKEPNAFEIDDEDEYENAFKQKRELNAFCYDELDYLKEQRRKLEEETKQENTNIMHM